MLSFKNLKVNENIKVVHPDNPIPLLDYKIIEYVEKANIGVGKITLFNKPKPKIDKALARVTEPGYKIPTGQFHSVSQWCDTCQEVQGFAHKPEKRRMICLTCKTIKTY